MAYDDKYAIDLSKPIEDEEEILNELKLKEISEEEEKERQRNYNLEYIGKDILIELIKDDQEILIEEYTDGILDELKNSEEEVTYKLEEAMDKNKIRFYIFYEIFFPDYQSTRLYIDPRHIQYLLKESIFDKIEYPMDENSMRIKPRLKRNVNFVKLQKDHILDLWCVMPDDV